MTDGRCTEQADTNRKHADAVHDEFAGTGHRQLKRRSQTPQASTAKAPCARQNTVLLWSRGPGAAARKSVRNDLRAKQDTAMHGEAEYLGWSATTSLSTLTKALSKRGAVGNHFPSSHASSTFDSLARTPLSSGIKDMPRLRWSYWHPRSFRLFCVPPPAGGIMLRVSTRLQGKDVPRRHAVVRGPPLVVGS